MSDATPQVVSTLSIVFMSITAFLSTIVPIGVMIVLGIRKRMKWKSMLVGALMFFFFVMILETLMHRVVLGVDPTQSAVYRSLPLYMLYAAFAAGIFEETARFLAFRFLLRVRENESIHTGISYGLGHGGIESIMIAGITAIGNILMATALNSGSLDSISAALSGEQLETFKTAVNTLSTTPSYIFLISGVERLSALVIQIALSIVVLKAVTDRKWSLFGLAIVLHAGVDMVAVLFQRGLITNIFVMEGIVLAAAVVIAIAAARIYRRKAVS